MDKAHVGTGGARWRTWEASVHTAGPVKSPSHAGPHTEAQMSAGDGETQPRAHPFEPEPGWSVRARVCWGV